MPDSERTNSDESDETSSTGEDDLFDEVDVAEVDEQIEQQQADVVDNAEPDPQVMALENLDDITDLVNDFFDQRRKNKEVDQDLRERVLAHRWKIVRITAGTFVAVVGISAYMTIEGALSGDAFTFVLGTLFGSILTFLQNNLQRENAGE
jgi:hypothetical protein